MKIRESSPLALLRLLIMSSTATLFSAGSVSAQGFLENTGLIDIHLGSKRSDAVRHLRNGGYELADGTAVRFDPWYRSNWRDLSISFLTQVTPSSGLIWGLSTGERGGKYHIAPSIEVGAMIQIELSHSSRLTFSASTKLGGLLQEQTCTADYGAIGGIQQVNCRLAASTLAPADTLDYLLYVSAREEAKVALVYELRF